MIDRRGCKRTIGQGGGNKIGLDTAAFGRARQDEAERGRDGIDQGGTISPVIDRRIREQRSQQPRVRHQFADLSRRGRVRRERDGGVASVVGDAVRRCAARLALADIVLIRRRPFVPDRLVQIERNRDKFRRGHVGADRQRWSVVVEVDLARNIRRRGRRVAVAILDRYDGRDRARSQRNLIIRIGRIGVMEREIFNHGDLAGDRIDGHGKGGGAAQFGMHVIRAHCADHPARAIHRQRNRRSVSQRHAGIGRLQIERIRDRRSRIGSVDAEVRQDAQGRTATGRVGEHRSGLIRIVAGVCNIREDRQRTCDIIGLVAGSLVRGHPEIADHRRRHQRPVILELNAAGNVGRCRGVIAIAVGNRHGCLDLAEGVCQRDRLIDIAADIGAVMVKRNILDEGHLAAHRIDRNRKRGRIVGAGHVIAEIGPIVTTDDQAVLEEQEDLLPFRSSELGIDRAGRALALRVGQRQREDLGAGLGRAVGAVIHIIDGERRDRALRVPDRKAKGHLRVVSRIADPIEDGREQNVVVVAERRALQQQGLVVNDGKAFRHRHRHRRTIIVEGDERSLVADQSDLDRRTGLVAITVGGSGR